MRIQYFRLRAIWSIGLDMFSSNGYLSFLGVSKIGFLHVQHILSFWKCVSSIVNFLPLLVTLGFDSFSGHVVQRYRQWVIRFGHLTLSPGTFRFAFTPTGTIPCGNAFRARVSRGSEPFGVATGTAMTRLADGSIMVMEYRSTAE